MIIWLLYADGVVVSVVVLVEGCAVVVVVVAGLFWMEGNAGFAGVVIGLGLLFIKKGLLLNEDAVDDDEPPVGLVVGGDLTGVVGAGVTMRDDVAVVVMDVVVVVTVVVVVVAIAAPPGGSIGGRRSSKSLH